MQTSSEFIFLVLYSFYHTLLTFFFNPTSILCFKVFQLLHKLSSLCIHLFSISLCLYVFVVFLVNSWIFDYYPTQVITFCPPFDGLLLDFYLHLLLLISTTLFRTTDSSCIFKNYYETFKTEVRHLGLAKLNITPYLLCKNF